MLSPEVRNVTAALKPACCRAYKQVIGLLWQTGLPMGNGSSWLSVYSGASDRAVVIYLFSWSFHISCGVSRRQHL